MLPQPKVVSFFSLFIFSDTVLRVQAGKVCPFFRFSKLRTQIHASAAKSCVLFYTFHIFGHSIRHFLNHYMRSQNKIDIYITSWRQGAIRSRPAAGEFENADEGGSSLINAPPTAFRAALLLQTVLPTAIPSGAPP